MTGADVIVTATAGLAGITYVLSGTTADGMFKIYSDNDFVLRLDGVQITNLNGPGDQRPGRRGDHGRAGRPAPPTA